MDVLIVAGVSKSQGSQFSVKKGVHLAREGKIMSYANLRRHFGADPVGEALLEVPYLAGIYLYNYLQKRDVSCGLINFLDQELDQFETLLKAQPKLIALSSTFLTDVAMVKSVTEVIRSYAPNIPIVLGGPLVYNSYLLYQRRESEYDVLSAARDYFFLTNEKEDDADIDYFVVDEQGEHTLYQMVRAIRNGQDVRSIANLAYYEKDTLVFTERQVENNAFEEDLVDWSTAPAEMMAPLFPVRGSRGCPYKCAYCNFFLGRQFRLKSSDLLAREVDALAETGCVRMIRFTDDNLFLTHSHVEEYCRKLIAARKNLRWTSFVRASSITRDNVQLLKDSGCVMAQIGMESGSRKILNNMQKDDIPEHYLEVIDLLNAQGISTQLYFIVGFPGETEETIQETIDMINRFSHAGPGINTIMVFPFVLAPLSPVYQEEQRKKYNLSGYMTDWSHDTMNFRQAYEYAQQLPLQLENIHPFYGIDEFDTVDLVTLKEVSELRTRIRKAELLEAPPAEIDAQWRQLQTVVTR